MCSRRGPAPGLEVGAVAESVEVTAAAPLLETDTSATGHVVEGAHFYRLHY